MVADPRLVATLADFPRRLIELAKSGANLDEWVFVVENSDDGKMWRVDDVREMFLARALDGQGPVEMKKMVENLTGPAPPGRACFV
jgi:hypothetical protein